MKKPSESGVYKIINLINNKIYIGSSIDLEGRKRSHFKLLKRNNHPNIYLQNSYNKYGRKNFKFETIEYVNRINDIKEFKKNLLGREQFYIDNTDIQIYNILPIAGSPLGHKDSEETREKKRQAMLGRTITKEWRAKIGKANKGRKPCEKTLERSRQCHLGKISWNKGIPWNDEVKEKISKANKGRKRSLEAIEKTRLGNIGKKLSQEHINRIKESKYKKIINKTTGEIFDSMTEAVIKYKLNHGNLSEVCSGLRKTTGGYEWGYLENYGRGQRDINRDKE